MSDYANSDVRNKAAAERRRSRPVTAVSPLGARNILLTYGQSNGFSGDTAPALSTEALEGTFMLGDGPMPVTGSVGEFIPIGGAHLSPLKAVSLTTPRGLELTDGTLLPPSSIVPPELYGLIPPGSKCAGETPEVAAVQLLQRLCIRKGRTVEFIAGTAAQGGKSLLQLSKGANPNYWGRIPSFLQQVQAHAPDAALTGIVQLQGEGEAGEPEDRSSYHKLLTREEANLRALNGKPPTLLLWIPGGDYTRGNPWVSEAIQEYCIASPTAFSPGPYYPYPDRIGFHLTNFGVRNVGLKTAQVLNRILNEGLTWEPFTPLQIATSGSLTALHFSVPAPPVRLQPVWRDGAMLEAEGYGFYAVDADGLVRPSWVRLAAPTVIEVSWERPPHQDASVCYAGQPTRGLGNVCDSDDFLDREDIGPRRGPHADEIPLSSENWLVPFTRPANWTASDL